MTHSTLFTTFSTAFARAAAGALIGLAGSVIVPVAAGAGQVSGTLTGYNSTAPEPSRDLHFQNRYTRDIYLSPSHTDGSFAQDLPPGIYDLRTETGVILKSSINVGRDKLPLGIVNEAAPLAPGRLFERQTLAPSILTSPAPSTAYVMTLDATVPSSNSTLVPKPEIDWAQAPSALTAEAPPPVPVAPPINSAVMPKLSPNPPALEAAPQPANPARVQP